MITSKLKLTGMALCVSPTPPHPRWEREQANRCAGFAFYAALKAVIKKFIP